MSRHDARISKNKYVIRMLLAILISLGIGFITGYYYAKISDTPKDNKNNVKPKNTVTNPTKVNQPDNKTTEPKDNSTSSKTTEKDVKEEPKSDEKPNEKSNEKPIAQGLSSQQQREEAKKLLDSYYAINAAFYAKTLGESNGQDSTFKNKMISAYEGVMIQNSLNNIQKVVNAGSISGYYFSDFYNGKRDTKILSYEASDYKDDTMKVKAQITNSFLYYSIPNSEDFFSSLKGKGLTNEQYVKMILQKPKRIRVLETRSDQYDLTMVDKKWYISNDKSQIISTEITEVIFEDKTWSFKEFYEKYLR